MFSNQIVSYGRSSSIAIGLAAALLAGGCSMFHSSKPVAAASAPVPVTAVARLR